MKESHFVKKYSVQFINQHGKLSEPFYFWDNKPHESSQTWQVRPQRVRQAQPRPRPRERREGPRRRPRAGGAVRGEAAVGVRVKPEDGPEREVRAKVVIDASGQSTLIIDRFGLRDWDPKLKKAALWTYWKGAVRDTGQGRGRDTRHPDRRARRAGSGTSRCTTTSSRSASSRTTTTSSSAARRTWRRSTSRRSRRRRACSRGSRTRRAATSSASRRSTPTAPSRPPATAGCWSATRSASSTRSTRPACCSR